jgi:hypothetical protein
MMKLMDGDQMLKWRWIARDGADLPANQAIEMDAVLRFAAGMILDYEFTPTKTGTIRLTFEEVEPFPGAAPQSAVTINVR